MVIFHSYVGLPEGTYTNLVAVLTFSLWIVGMYITPLAASWIGTIVWFKSSRLKLIGEFPEIQDGQCEVWSMNFKYYALSRSFPGLFPADLHMFTAKTQSCRCAAKQADGEQEKCGGHVPRSWRSTLGHMGQPWTEDMTDEMTDDMIWLVVSK